MEQDPFGSFLCPHYAALEAEAKNGRGVIAKHKEVRNVANYQ
jgi:hypothetical protein